MTDEKKEVKEYVVRIDINGGEWLEYKFYNATRAAKRVYQLLIDINSIDLYALRFGGDDSEYTIVIPKHQIESITYSMELDIIIEELERMRRKVHGN